MSDNNYNIRNTVTPDTINTDLGWNDTYNKKFIKILATEEVRQNRISICESCEKFKLYFCTECNCYMPFKTRIETYSCPKNKW